MLIKDEIKADLEELVDLTNDNIEGLEELTILAQGLKDFSRLDRAPIDSFNVNEGIERTLVIAKNVLKSKVNVIKNLADVPPVDNGFVSVAVNDNGCGIPEDIMTKIRDPFFTTKEVGTGTGLGLSICEEILRSHNGRLDIESEVGVGSTFTILLPYKVPADNQDEALFDEDDFTADEIFSGSEDEKISAESVDFALVS